MDSERTGKYHQRKLKDYDEILEGIDEVEKYEESHSRTKYEIELIEAKSGTFGVLEKGRSYPTPDLLDQMFIEPFK